MSDQSSSRSAPVNHLIHEKSPYLQQHAHNPVDWYPWGEDAFAKARREDKPILVSIGYSTCHWCHVMERESFEDAEIARVMNENLVCIKVDREERPDVDKIYMTAVTAMAGQGGWPLNAFLTPDLKPFYGGTYFPPTSRWGVPAWPDVVKQLGQAWKDPAQRKKITESAGNLAQRLSSYLNALSSDVIPAKAGIQKNSNVSGFRLTAAGMTEELEWLHKAQDSFAADYDALLGGFGGAPKFPMPVNHNFLLRYTPQAQDMSIQTLKAMGLGGIYDQLGGGFHRYSTDEYWHVPHFEKMLYDNAQLASVYVDAYQITKDADLARVARETLDYALRDMTHPDGGFYSAEDADSIPHPAPSPFKGEGGGEGRFESVEGAFYVWEKEEILKALGPEKGEVFSFAYGVKSEGNAKQDPHGEFTNKNILFAAHTLKETAERFKKPEKEIQDILTNDRRRLLEVRRKRPRPHLDDKVLTSWNGLMISAFSRAYPVLDDPRYLQAAEKAASFIRRNLYDAQTHRLYRRWRDGQRQVPATADDYAFLIQGLLDLYETSFEAGWLQWALQLTEEMNRQFYDEKQGGYFMTALDSDPHLLFRVKEDVDNVEPSASSVAALNLLRLSQFADRSDFREKAEKTLQAFAPQLKQSGRSLPQMLVALNYALGKPLQIIIAGDTQAAGTHALLKEVNARFIPNKVLMVVDDGKNRKILEGLLPFLKNIAPLKGKPTAYVCENYTCKLPTSDPAALRSILDSSR